MTQLRASWPPDPFRYLEGRLCVGGLPLDEVVAATGTPAYVYDLDAVAAAYRRVAAAFEPLGARVLYAVKANANLAVLATLAGLGSGFDVVSGGELVRVLRAGGDPGACVFASVGKTTEELELAVGHGVTVHVESADELDALRSEEHTSELQSLTNLVCRLLLEKKKKKVMKQSQQKLNKSRTK